MSLQLLDLMQLPTQLDEKMRDGLRRILGKEDWWKTVEECRFFSYHMLEQVERWLAEDVPARLILELIAQIRDGSNKLAGKEKPK